MTRAMPPTDEPVFPGNTATISAHETAARIRGMKRRNRIAAVVPSDRRADTRVAGSGT
jgi:hypothetical protein